MTLKEIIQEKIDAGINVVIGCYSDYIPITQWTTPKFGKRSEQIVVGRMRYDWYYVKENGICTMRVGAASQGENRLYEYDPFDKRSHLVAQRVPYDPMVQNVLTELKGLYEEQENAKKVTTGRTEEETTQIIETQKRRVYGYLPKNSLSECRLTLGGILEAKKRNGSKIDIESKEIGKILLLWIMENGKPILKVKGEKYNDTSYQYLDKDFLRDADVWLYVNDEPTEPEPEIMDETCMSIFYDVFALYDAQEKEKNAAQERQQAAERQKQMDAFYAQWLKGAQGKPRGGAC